MRRALVVLAAMAVIVTASAALLPAAPSSIWPGFRGTHASGVADGQKIPDTWNADTRANILWQVGIPGLAHSSPIVWNDRIYVTTAISSKADATFKPGLY